MIFSILDLLCCIFWNSKYLDIRPTWLSLSLCPSFKFSASLFALCSKRFPYSHLSNFPLNYFNFSKQMSNFPEYFCAIVPILLYPIIFQIASFWKSPKVFFYILSYSLISFFQTYLFCLFYHSFVILLVSCHISCGYFWIKDRLAFSSMVAIGFLCFSQSFSCNKAAGRDFCEWRCWICQKTVCISEWAGVGLQIPRRQGLFWGICTPLISFNSPPGSYFHFLRKEVSSFQLKGELLGYTVPGRRKTV